MNNVECLLCNFPWDIFFLALLLGLILWWLVDRITGARLRKRMGEKIRKLSMVESENNRMTKEFKEKVSSFQADGDRMKQEHNEKISALKLDFDKLKKEYSEKLSFWESEKAKTSGDQTGRVAELEAELQRVNSELEKTKAECGTRVEEMRTGYENMLVSVRTETRQQTETEVHAADAEVIKGLEAEIERLKTELETVEKNSNAKIEELRSGYEKMLHSSDPKQSESGTEKSNSEIVKQLEAEVENLKNSYELKIKQLQSSAVTLRRMDDLKIVEGIGPAIEKLCNEADIYSFTELAATPVSHLQEILEAAGPSFSMHDPGTWSAQAALARDSRWEQLWKWQRELKGGKEE